MAHGRESGVVVRPGLRGLPVSSVAANGTTYPTPVEYLTCSLGRPSNPVLRTVRSKLPTAHRHVPYFTRFRRPRSPGLGNGSGFSGCPDITSVAARKGRGWKSSADAGSLLAIRFSPRRRLENSHARQVYSWKWLAEPGSEPVPNRNWKPAGLGTGRAAMRVGDVESGHRRHPIIPRYL